MNQTGENAYTILETLRKSKHFLVYKAKNYFRGNLVTIKSIDQRWRSDPTINRQLRNEAEAGMRLRHPVIRQTTGLFEDDGTIYMVSEFIEGDPLSKILSIPKVDIGFDQARKWTLQLLEALEYAHSQRQIHINLNPQQVIITPAYDAKLFGFGKPPGAWKTAEAERNEFHPLLFTAPEVFSEDNPDERSDVYSLGVLAYLLFCGQLPWPVDQRESPSQQKQSTLHRLVTNPELHSKHLPSWLFGVLNKALMLDPGRRFASAAEMRNAIETQQEIPFESCLTGYTPKAQTPAPDATAPTPETALERSKNRGFVIPIPGRKSASGRMGTSNTAREDLSQLRKLARLLGYAALFILAYVIVKYVIINHQPKFSKVQGEEREDQGTKPIPNKPADLIQIPGGAALIGSSASTADANEAPAHEVALKTFYLGAAEVTKAEWAMANRDFTVADDEHDLPITKVSFLEIVDFCNAKSKAEGLQPCYEYLEDGVTCDFAANGYRLPTEAEWEYAARSTRGSYATLYSGSDAADGVAWFADNADGSIHPVKQKPPNSLGLYDMSGNAAEWVWDWYASYSASEGAPFSGPGTGIDRVVRGGSFRSPATAIRVTSRDHRKPFTRLDDLGFRLARSKK